MTDSFYNEANVHIRKILSIYPENCGPIRLILRKLINFENEGLIHLGVEDIAFLEDVSTVGGGLLGEELETFLAMNEMGELLGLEIDFPELMEGRAATCVLEIMKRKYDDIPCTVFWCLECGIFCCEQDSIAKYCSRDCGKKAIQARRSEEGRC